MSTKWTKDEHTENIIGDTLRVARNFKSLLEIQIVNKTKQLEDVIAELNSRKDELNGFVKEVRVDHEEAKRIEKEERKKRQDANSK